jgi:hypothetical protein
MNPPTVNAIPNVAPDVDQLGTHVAAPGFGHLAVNAYLLRCQQPVLVDAGIGTLQESTLNALAGIIDPADLRWIYLTHVDGDHVGCLDRLMTLAPRARIVTTYLGMAKLSFSRTLPPERFWLLNPGEALDVGDRRLLALRPPCFDAPETTMLWDPTSRTTPAARHSGRSCRSSRISGPARSCLAWPASFSARWATPGSPSRSATGKPAPAGRPLAPSR